MCKGWLGSMAVFLWLINLSWIKGQDGIFTLIAPRTIFPSHNYTFLVNGNPSQASAPPPIRVQIYCQPNLSLNLTSIPNVHIQWQIISLKPNQSWYFHYLTDATLVSERYRLCKLIVVHGNTSEVLDKRTLQLTSETTLDSSKIFLQMDKPAYKPGDHLRLNLVFLNEHNIPDPSPTFKVILVDPRDIRMNKWPKSSNGSHGLKLDENGLLKISFPLAKELPLGEWKIIVETKLSRLVKPFLIQRYVLPKFFLKFKLGPKAYLTPSSTDFHAEVYASYTYGKSLEGSISLTLFNVLNPAKTLFKTTSSIKGSVFIQINAQTLGPLTAGMTFMLQGNVTEANTGRFQVSSHQIRVFDSDPYQITWLNPQEVFRPNVPLIVKIAVSDFNHLPVSDERETALELSSTFENADHQIERKSITLSGIVSFSLNVPSDTRTKFKSISVQYKSKTIDLPVPRPFRSSGLDDCIMTIDPLDGVRNVKGETVSLSIRTSSCILTKVNYVLWSGTEIVDFKSGQNVSESGQPSSSGLLRVWLPMDKVYAELKVVVYFVHGPKAAIVSAGQTIPTNNYLILTLNKKNMEPAKEDLRMTFQTDPGSTVAIRAVDFSNLLLSRDKDNNDVDPRSVPFNPYHSPKIQPNPTSRSDFHNQFLSVGLDILTNGHLGEASSEIESPMSTSLVGRSKRNAELWGDEDDRALLNNQIRDREVRVRKYFPEVWLWEDLLVTNASTEFRKSVLPVPDTITSWYITALSINKQSGFAVTAAPEILTIFRPFFITLNLPYSVFKGDTFELQVILHNYLGHDIIADVTFINHEVHYRFVDTREIRQVNVTRKVHVKSNQVNVVGFVFSCLTTGLLPLDVRAVTDEAGDAIHTVLRVEHPGYKVYSQTAPFSYHGKHLNSTRDYRVHSSRKRRDEVQKLTISPNIVKSQIPMENHENVKSLVSLPTGCGEQTMNKFVRNILALEYRKALKKLDSTYDTEIRSYLEVGYNEQMTFFNSEDGSFNYHTTSFSSSTWLTAFILRCITDASKHIFVDERNVIVKGLKFLLSKQNPVTGEFQEDGDVLYQTALGGGLSSRNSTRYGVSAYVTLAIMEIATAMVNVLTKAEFISLVAAKTKGLKYISSESSLMNSDTYSLLLVTATLNAAQDNSSKFFFEKVEKLALTNNNGEWKWWQYDRSFTETTTSALSVEMTAYALMVHLSRPQNGVAQALPIVKWLIKERSPTGDFKSTQDTVVALTALSRFFTKTQLSEGENEVDVLVITSTNETMELKVNGNNFLEVHDMLIPNEAIWFDIQIKGRGHVHFAHSQCLYTKKLPNDTNSFRVEGTLTSVPGSKSEFQLRLCVSALDVNGTGQVTGNVKLPTGYSFDRQSVEDKFKPHSRNYNTVKNVQLEEHDTMAVIYYSHLTRTPSCLDLDVVNVHNVVSNQPGKIEIIDYYNPGHSKSIEIYSDKRSTVCDLCLRTGECDLVEGCRAN